ncbi:MAG TPA: SidA/IucD/PvdA family monooxygenase, partial [Actinospica sp.]|nr:SidA/IucD/PvdA family monooxygenase [Actinospica sp.]
LRWLTRSAAFEPMEYSKIGLEHFTPDYTDYFHALPEAVRDQLLASQGRLYKAVSDETLAEIRVELDRRAYPDGPASTGVTLLPGLEATGGRLIELPNSEELDLEFLHARTHTTCVIRTQRLVLATGYAQRQPRLLGPLDALVRRDSRGRPLIQRDHRVVLEGTEAGLYVQNAELYTHGVGTPDLGLGAYRAASILNAVAGREVYRLPARTAHTSFSPAAAAFADEAITRVTALPAQAARARHAQRTVDEQRQIPSQPEERRDRRPSAAPSRAGTVVAAGGDPDRSAGPATAGPAGAGGDPDRRPPAGVDDPAAAPEGLG